MAVCMAGRFQGRFILLLVLAGMVFASGCSGTTYREFSEGNFRAAYPEWEAEENLPHGILLRVNGEFTYEIYSEPISGGFAETVEAGLAEFYETDELEILRKEIGEREATISYRIDFGEGQVITAIERGMECNGKIYWVNLSGFGQGFRPDSGTARSLLENAGCVE